MNPVIVRNLKIGEGLPKICVPIVGKTKEDILCEARCACEETVDMVEWRADYFDQVFDCAQMKVMLVELRKILGEIPLLFTFRTAGEGGEKEIEWSTYEALNKLAAESGMTDLIDVEVFGDENIVSRIIKTAHENEVFVVGSNHDFQKTPQANEMMVRLLKMQAIGADILKIAVMPQNMRDVIEVLSVTERMSREHGANPIVTMSMGGAGMISRISGEIFGSAITFGALDQASAPGQIPVKELKELLQMIHKGLTE